jgi:hypothetical protein
MKIKNKKDFGLGVFCILFAAVIIYLSLQLKATGYEGDPGPKMFPIIGSVIMAVCGIALIVAPEKNQKVFLTKTQWKAAGALFGMYVLFALLLWLFGFLVAVPVMLFIITFMLSKLSVKDATVKHRLLISLIYGVVGGAVLYLAYVVGLKASMPTGVLIELLKK